MNHEKAARDLGLAASALSLGASAAQLHAAPLRGFEHRIAEAVTAGRLDSGRAALYRLYALKAPDQLPAEYRTPAAGPTGRQAQSPSALARRARCGTTLLRAVREGIATLPAAERAEAEALLAPERPRGAARVTALNGKAVPHALANWLETANFSIEWGPTSPTRTAPPPPGTRTAKRARRRRALGGLFRGGYRAR